MTIMMLTMTMLILMVLMVLMMMIRFLTLEHYSGNLAQDKPRLNIPSWKNINHIINRVPQPKASSTILNSGSVTGYNSGKVR